MSRKKSLVEQVFGSAENAVKFMRFALFIANLLLVVGVGIFMYLQLFAK